MDWFWKGVSVLIVIVCCLLIVSPLVLGILLLCSVVPLWSFLVSLIAALVGVAVLLALGFIWFVGTLDLFPA